MLFFLNSNIHESVMESCLRKRAAFLLKLDVLDVFFLVCISDDVFLAQFRLSRKCDGEFGKGCQRGLRVSSCEGEPLAQFNFSIIISQM